MTRPVTAATIAALVFVAARQAGRIARLNRRVRQLRGDTLEQARDRVGPLFFHETTVDDLAQVLGVDRPGDRGAA